MARPAEARRHLAAGLAGWFLLAAASPATGDTLELPLPRGAQETHFDGSALDSFDLPVGPFASGDLPARRIEGIVARRAFGIDNDSITLLQILAPIRAHLEQSGFDILLDCDEVTCGGYDFRFSVEVLPAPAMFVDLTAYRYLSAAREDEAVALLASGSATRRFLQVIHVGPPGASEGARQPGQMAAPQPAQTSGLVAALLRDGRIPLDDLTFSSARTALTEGPYPSLEALAAYIRAHPGTRIALVGHTDAVGALEGNIAISRARADAVVRRLVETHGVPAGQVRAEGIGFLSPRASNRTDAGRAANRRVEAVLLDVE